MAKASERRGESKRSRAGQRGQPSSTGGRAIARRFPAFYEAFVKKLRPRQFNAPWLKHHDVAVSDEISD